jgi:hypothetical protein
MYINKKKHDKMNERIKNLREIIDILVYEEGTLNSEQTKAEWRIIKDIEKTLWFGNSKVK